MGWDVVDGSYAYLAKSIPLDMEHPADSIRHAVEDLNELRTIVEPHLDDIVTAHQRSTD